MSALVDVALTSEVSVSSIAARMQTTTQMPAARLRGPMPRRNLGSALSFGGSFEPTLEPLLDKGPHACHML